jgi:hypothetical protein
VLSPPESPLGKQLRNYVCVRIIRMDNVDIALFDYDRNNTLYFFLMNADEEIYMRYGGRDSRSPDSYLNLDSLALAAEKGLALHKRYQAGQWVKKARLKPASPRDYPLLVERTYKSNACVECHLIGDFQNIHRERDGTLDKLVHLFRSPDIRTIGIELDVPKGLAVKAVSGPAEAAGMRAGDRIAKWEGEVVYTFGDLQWKYDHVQRTAKSVSVTVERDGGTKDLTVALPVRWWWTDTRYRQSSVEPRSYFEDRALTAEEKAKLGLPAEGFASAVKYVSSMAYSVGAHDLKVGDIIVGVDGKDRDGISDTASLYIVLHKTPGDTGTLEVLREGKKISMPLKTVRMSFRK